MLTEFACQVKISGANKIPTVVAIVDLDHLKRRLLDNYDPQKLEHDTNCFKKIICSNATLF